ncbi:DoxX family protein [Pyxidicoccus fallax]|uniref:DoxX family protein n=1 Tax=Pyxidicoccus fallax TaxID=394095 RepID=A0A848LE55_9BACT|nr:DoxX family membrane protein [Pyxidicoccus fallax]NMO15095.1 DoxX family protein [Pyxidicoccus fallax]NPC79791.1 DoxX family protein [Pyxidicoccus fallax]
MGTGTTLNVEVAGAGQGTKSLTRHIPTVVRFLMGLLFFVFGLNGFLNFIPPPAEPMPEASVAFSEALMKTGYMFPLIKGTEVLVGVLLLANRFVPLALTLLAPVMVNIVAFHVFLAPMGMGMTVVLLVMHLYLAWAYRAAFRPMLAFRATPGAK